jgi:molybdenum cofactor guanylyltransferase
MSGVNGFVLAGGQSRRMGRDKALLPYAGTTLLEHALETLRAVCDGVAIAGCRDDLAAYAPVIQDAFRDCGPLGGIYAALEHSQVEWNLFLAVDLPRIEPSHLKKLLAHPRTPETRTILAHADGRLQPLCGLYHRSLAAPIAEALAAGERAVIPVLESIVDAHGLERVWFDEDDAFLNLNTPEDVATLGVQ